MKIETHAHQSGAPAPTAAYAEHLCQGRSVTMPVLVLAADADLLAPPSMMRAWAAHLKNYEFAAVPEPGHSVAWEQPELFNEKADLHRAELGRAATVRLSERRVREALAVSAVALSLWLFGEFVTYEERWPILTFLSFVASPEIGQHPDATCCRSIPPASKGAVGAGHASNFQ